MTPNDGDEPDALQRAFEAKRLERERQHLEQDGPCPCGSAERVTVLGEHARGARGCRFASKTDELSRR